MDIRWKLSWYGDEITCPDFGVRLESETVSILGAHGTRITTMRRRDGGRYVKREMDAAELYREILAQRDSAKVVRV